MLESIKNWIKDHDDRWSFVILYVGGAVCLSVFMNLFWVVMLMTGNFFLKFYRNCLLAMPKPLLTSLWQVKLDIALVIFALMIGLYAEHVFAALGLSQAARAGQAVRGLQMATRFGLIERGLKVFLMTIDDQARLVNAVVKARKKKKSGQIVVPEEALPEREEEDVSLPWKKWGKGDVFSVAFGAVCLCLILMAPVLTGHTYHGLSADIVSQLHP